MKAILNFAFAIILAGFVASGFAKTMSVPDEKSPAYTVDIPDDWSPKISDETVEATEPDNHVYVSGWTVTKEDVGDLKKDLGGLLKEEMKSIDGEPSEETIENNGIKFTVLKGHGKDKREGTDVKFMVALFAAGEGKAGLFYADWDADAPADITKRLNDLMNSIKVHK